MLSSQALEQVQDFAKEIRKKTLYTIGNLGVGHIGGALSVVDILALLYAQEMQVDPKNPLWKNRDLLVLSKGHSGPALYATLALLGFFPLKELDTLNQGGTNLPSHCDRLKTPGIDMSTGSLGQGLSAACGLALSRRMDKNPCYTYAIIGDGESQEGQNWEAGMFASQYKLDHLIAFTDYNKLQIDGTTDDIMSLGDIEGKWKTFGWYVQRVNGHDYSAMHQAIENAKQQEGKPSMIILDTIKGKGAAFCEGLVSNHNMNFDLTVANKAIAELG
ncbi:transketolase, beta subunit [Sphaerochaeta pleomorpha str. Grapes]|uniref:Transketolase, beta subunit n=1 Tax=Sphaerochaeta pleomorpha (strain ATCC BAA-1885 / DSM 22778 / Grapes) TaxID=158190 RepID=G8QU41_SPHPG|nr:transketolase [Sphaerochaeta pleomorpha]AEV30288.1 transketolase, beta subunit [Sphaerochaeta pleomorpha str. Grapes]